MPTVHSIEETLYTAVASFLSALPRVVGALLILVIGWIIAGMVGKFVQKMLDRVGADRITKRAGIDAFMERAGVKGASAGGIVGWIAKWYIRVLVLEAAIGALGIDSVSATFDKFASYLPSLAVAVIILCVGAFLAKLASEAVRGITAGAGFGNSKILGSLTSGVVIALAFVAALQQAHIAETLVNELLIAVLAASALAAGLAFGLGGREVAAELLGSAYDSGKKAAARANQSSGGPDPAIVGQQVAQAGSTAQAQQRQQAPPPH